MVTSDKQAFPDAFASFTEKQFSRFALRNSFAKNN
jgi:hypothetical protein